MTLVEDGKKDFIQKVSWEQVWNPLQCGFTVGDRSWTQF